MPPNWMCSLNIDHDFLRMHTFMMPNMEWKGEKLFLLYMLFDEILYNV